MEKVYSDLAPRFKDRNGGYTQIFRLAQPRVGDCAPMCLIQYLPGAETTPEVKGNKGAGKSKKEPKKADKAPEDKPVKKEAKKAAPKAEKKASKKKES
jgi:large subunit ribosomal protein L17